MASLLHAWKRLFDRPTPAAGPQVEDIRAWQKTLLEEQEGLRNELEVLLRTYVRTVDRFVERASALPEPEFLQEQATIESIRRILQNAIRRLEVSCKDHRELMDEWHEWVAFRRAAGQRHELEPAHRLRVEMIRSELAARDIQVEEPMRPQERRVEVESAPLPVQQPITAAASIRSSEPVLDDLADWMDLRRTHIEPEWQAAERSWNQLAPAAHLHPEHAAATLRRLKEAHADLRLLDRARRQQRYRIAVFST